MILINEKEKCCGCGACKQICPQKCIHLKEDFEGFEYPSIESDKCINCKLCKQVCPILQYEKKQAELPEAWVAFCNDDQIRYVSSSGGLFTLFAKKILNCGGVVFGAALSDNRLVHHIGIDNLANLEELQGSKYVQSNTENTYYEVKEALCNKKPVLYSGTACQIAGLKKYLGKEYPDLFTIDVLCHGVPSPKLWEKYISYQEEKMNAPVQKTYFRKKNPGWKRYSLELIFANRNKYTKVFTEDYYMNMFLKNICLRPSCHACMFKEISRPSDITIGDCWGIEHYMPEMDDDKGTSVVLIHSDKGKKLFGSIAEYMEKRLAELDKAISPQADSRKSVDIHPKREKFFQMLDNGAGIERLYKLTKPTFVDRTLWMVRRIINKLKKYAGKYL